LPEDVRPSEAEDARRLAAIGKQMENDDDDDDDDARVADFLLVSRPESKKRFAEQALAHSISHLDGINSKSKPER